MSSSDDHIAHSYEEARVAASRWNVVSCAPFRNKVKLDTEVEWMQFFDLCGAIKRESGEVVIELVTVLKKMYAIAFSAPHTPPMAYRIVHTAPDPLMV